MSGHLAQLWRYPVSSMGGEALTAVSLSAGGIEGDRIWGLLDAQTGRIASPGREKHFVTVPRAHARMSSDGVAVSADGTRWAGPDDATMLAELSQDFGFMPLLKPFDPLGSAGFRPRYEHAPIHLLTTAAMRSLGRDLPGSAIDARRFRPNFVVEWPDAAEEVPEHDWIGREIFVGDVVLRGRALCGRCGFVTIEQDGLPLDVEVLRSVVKKHGRNFGIYCDVVTPGRVSTGDRVAVAA